jgi:hypothetical protein
MPGGLSAPLKSTVSARAKRRSSRKVIGVAHSKWQERPLLPVGEDPI